MHQSDSVRSWLKVTTRGCCAAPTILRLARTARPKMSSPRRSRPAKDSNHYDAMCRSQAEPRCQALVLRRLAEARSLLPRPGRACPWSASLSFVPSALRYRPNRRGIALLTEPGARSSPRTGALHVHGRALLQEEDLAALLRPLSTRHAQASCCQDARLHARKCPLLTVVASRRPIVAAP